MVNCSHAAKAIQRGKVVSVENFYEHGKSVRKVERRFCFTRIGSLRIGLEFSEQAGPKWIGWDAPIAWPPQSPDLFVPNFYLWRKVKESVYRERPKTEFD